MDRIRSQALEATQALETINDQETLRRLLQRLFLQRHYDDGHLLATIAEGCEQVSLVLRLLPAQRFVAPIELVKFQIHATPPAGHLGLRQRDMGLRSGSHSRIRLGQDGAAERRGGDTKLCRIQPDPPGPAIAKQSDGSCEQ